jgi:hypothetical protein
MRSRALRVLSAWLLGALPLAVRAQRQAAPAIELRIEAQDPLRVGTAAHADVFVRAADATQPLLLTPSSEGDAVHVVRGRLLRSDAQRTGDGELRFEVPLVVAGAGSAVLRIDVLTYRCARRCEAVRGTATRILHAAVP